MDEFMAEVFVDFVACNTTLSLLCFTSIILQVLEVASYLCNIGVTGT